jgi:zinc protease
VQHSGSSLATSDRARHRQRHLPRRQSAHHHASLAEAAAPDRSKPPQAGAPKPFTITEPSVFKLKNGLTVWHVPRKRAPLVDVLAVIDAGPLADPVDRPGVAKWTADLLTEGSGGQRAVEFSDAVQSLGAEISSTAEIDHAWLSLHVTSARLPAALKLYAQALLKPDFAEAEWHRIRGQLFGEMMYASQEPQELAQLAAQRANWGTASAPTSAARRAR